MPANDVYLSNLRADGHRVRLYYGKFDGSVVLNATVDTTPADQALDLTITTVSGSAANVRRGWLVRVETAGGLFKGITNVRAAGTISSTNLPIHELPKADIAIVAGDVLKVFNLPFLGDKLPVDAEGFAPDDLTYSDQGSAVPPRVNSGGHFIGMVDSGQSYATVPLSGVSTAEDPDSGGSLTYLTTLLTGTLAFAPGSASTDANPTIRASVGYGIAERVVTDVSNSKTQTQYVCFQTYSDAVPPYRLIDADLTADETNGWAGAFQTYAYSGLTELYDGQFGGVFARETINGVTVSYGTDIPNRAQIKLIGFLHRDENDLTPQIRRIHFNLQSPWMRLASLPGFSKVFTREAADWTLIEDLTIRLSIVHLLRYYSFFMEMFDVRFDAAFLNKLYSRLFLNKQTADKQIVELADGVDARVVCLRTGEMLIHTHPALIPLASRAAVTTTLTIAARDCLTAPFARDHWKTVETFELRGFSAGATADENQPLFSRYPSLTPGRGAQSLAAERCIVDDQTDANNRCGRRAAQADGVFMDANNVYTRAVEWDVTLPGSYDCFDFNKEYVATSLGASSNLRGVDLSAQRYYLARMRITYQGGTARVNPTFLTATNAPAGATYIPANEDSPPYTPPDFVPIPTPTRLPFPPYDGVLPTRGLVFSASEGKVAQITGLTGAGLTFGPDFGGVSNTEFYAAYSNPYLYKQAYGLGDVGLETSLDVSTNTAFTLLQTNTSLFGSGQIGHRIRGSIHRNGWGAAVSGANYFRSTLDGWATLQSAVSINGNALDPDDGSAINVRCDFCLCGHNAGHIYATAWTGGLAALYRSTDYGATWTLVYTSVFAYADCGRVWLDVPHMRRDGTPNRDDASIEIYLFVGGISGGGCGDIFIELIVGTSSLTSSGTPESLNTNALNNNPMTTFTYSGNQFYFIDRIGDVRHMDDFTLGIMTGSLINITAAVLSVNGWSPNPLPAIVWSRAGSVYVTTDGVTFVNGLPAGWAAGIAAAELSLWTIQ